jgi:hypothetical protein
MEPISTLSDDYELRRRALARYDRRLKELQDEYYAAVEHARQEYRDDLMALRRRACPERPFQRDLQGAYSCGS